MYSILEIPKRMLRWVLRFRHRCGYGIHSPFAFTFVCDVIYERSAYYAYSRLEKAYDRRSSRRLRRKDCRLLFRLANYVHPKVCSLCGVKAEGTWFEYLSAGSVSTDYRETLCPADLVVGDEDWAVHADKLLAAVNERGVLLVPGIDQSAERRQAWHDLLTQPKAQVTFDLGDFGILFYRPDLQREHYIINYL